jgi:hypothetical protein
LWLVTNVRCRDGLEGLLDINWRFPVNRPMFEGIRKVVIFELLERSRKSAALRTSISLLDVSPIDCESAKEVELTLRMLALMG